MRNFSQWKKNFTFFSADSGFCEKLDSENCPKSFVEKREVVETVEWKSADEYVRLFLNGAIESMDLIISMSLTGLTVLIFILGYYFINRARKEEPLIAKVRNFLNGQRACRLKVSGKICLMLLGITLKTFNFSLFTFAYIAEIFFSFFRNNNLIILDE